MSTDSLGRCTENCGKGANYGFLECDDGNRNDNDGCSSACKIEDGWICSLGNETTKD